MAKTLGDLTEWVHSLGHVVLMGWHVRVEDGLIVIFNPKNPNEFSMFGTDEPDETEEEKARG